MLLISVSSTTLAQRQKESISKDGAMVVNGDTIAYIEKEGCKMLNASCQFFITDEGDALVIPPPRQNCTGSHFGSAAAIIRNQAKNK